MSVNLYVQTTDGPLRNDGALPQTGGWVRPEAFQFPGGEWHLRNIPEIPKGSTLVADVRGADPNDLVKAALWSDVARQTPEGRFALFLPYLPAARADRGRPNGSHVYAEWVISMLHFPNDHVVCLDPHSKEMPQVLGSEPGAVPGVHSWVPCVIADHEPLIKRALEESGQKFDAVIAPDEGAEARARWAAEFLGEVREVPVLCAEKVRDFETGKLSGFKMIDRPVKDARYLIVDDICDGGGTFRGLAEHLYTEHGIKKEQMGLWVTHGIFSGQAHMLRNYFSWIGTTDSHPGCRSIGVVDYIDQPVVLQPHGGRAVADIVVPCWLTMHEELFATVGS